MVKQIKTALPSVKVGIIPMPIWGPNYTTQWAGEAATWAENCMTDLAAMGLSDTFIVPVWCHMNRDFIWPYSSTNALSSVNATKIGVISDGIHWGEVGKKQYINALSSFVLNVI
jgi:hypothetical protein